MTKFMQINVLGEHTYLNTNRIICTESNISNILCGLELVYSSVRNNNFKLQSYTSYNAKFMQYFVEAISNSNSSSHTNNIYKPELTQGNQPTINAIV